MAAASALEKLPCKIASGKKGHLSLLMPGAMICAGVSRRTALMLSYVQCSYICEGTLATVKHDKLHRVLASVFAGTCYINCLKCHGRTRKQESSSLCCQANMVCLQCALILVGSRIPLANRLYMHSSSVCHEYGARCLA